MGITQDEFELAIGLIHEQMFNDSSVSSVGLGLMALSDAFFHYPCQNVTISDPDPSLTSQRNTLPRLPRLNIDCNPPSTSLPTSSTPLYLTEKNLELLPDDIDPKYLVAHNIMKLLVDAWAPGTTVGIDMMSAYLSNILGNDLSHIYNAFWDKARPNTLLFFSATEDVLGMPDFWIAHQDFSSSSEDSSYSAPLKIPLIYNNELPDLFNYVLSGGGRTLLQMLGVMDTALEDSAPATELVNDAGMVGIYIRTTNALARLAFSDFQKIVMTSILPNTAYHLSVSSFTGPNDDPINTTQQKLGLSYQTGEWNTKYFSHHIYSNDKRSHYTSELDCLVTPNPPCPEDERASHLSLAAYAILSMCQEYAGTTGDNKVGVTAWEYDNSYIIEQTFTPKPGIKDFVLLPTTSDSRLPICTPIIFEAKHKNSQGPTLGLTDKDTATFNQQVETAFSKIERLNHFGELSLFQQDIWRPAMVNSAWTRNELNQNLNKIWNSITGNSTYDEPWHFLTKITHDIFLNPYDVN